MKNIILIIMLFFTSTVFSQVILNNVEGDVIEVVAGIAPTIASNAYGIIQGGKEKTAVGVLKIPVIIVRFKDDTFNTGTDGIWPDYNILPEWAQIVDSEIPANGIYQNVNLSNFFNRESGGDGNGVLGSFQVIGDVYYITTDENRSYYSSDGSVNRHVMQKLDVIINYKQYDNWDFMVGGEYYKHEYKPYNPLTGTGGDGNLDFIFIFWRDYSLNYTPTKAVGIGGYKGLDTNYPTSDGVNINSDDGSTQFYLIEKGGTFGTNSKRAVTAPAHEYTHYLFGGIGNVDTHWDGDVVHNYTGWTDPLGNWHQGHPDANVGMINRFALMTSSENYSYCAFEKYLLGWLEPNVVSSNSLNVAINDTHLMNDAVMVPIKYDVHGRLVEYYFIENFQTTNSYTDANPFKIKNLFAETFTHGLLVFHIEEMDFSINDYGSLSSSTYTKSKVDIVLVQREMDFCLI